MLERLFLQLAHRPVRTIDSGADTRPIAVLRFDCLGQPRIVRTKLEFERLPANREALLDRLKLHILVVVEA